MASEAKAELRGRLEALGKRIDEQRHHSAAASGVPYGASQWSDILATHGRLVRHINEERDHDSSTIDRMRADVEALSLSLDDWIRGIDRHFAGKGGSKS
jgi:hypothetical protein